MLQLQAGSRTLLHKELGMVEELVERTGDSSGDWEEELIAMNMEIRIYVQILCSSLLQGVAWPTGQKGFQVLSQGRTESITYV